MVSTCSRLPRRHKRPGLFQILPGLPPTPSAGAHVVSDQLQNVELPIFVQVVPSEPKVEFPIRLTDVPSELNSVLPIWVDVVPSEWYVLFPMRVEELPSEPKVVFPMRL